MTHDFGTIHLKNGPVKYKFSFCNMGNQPLKISAILSTNNSTKALWNKSDIAPKDSGFITVVYTPLKGGSFLHELSLLSNVAVLAPIKLFIKGEVIEKNVYKIKLKSAKVDSMIVVTYPKLLGSKKIMTDIYLSKDTVMLTQGKKKNIYKVSQSSYDDTQKTVFYYLPDGTSFQYFLETNEVIFQKTSVRHLVYKECTEIK